MWRLKAACRAPVRASSTLGSNLGRNSADDREDDFPAPADLRRGRPRPGAGPDRLPGAGRPRSGQGPQYGVIDPHQPRELAMVSMPAHVVEPPDELEISVRPVVLELPLTTVTALIRRRYCI